MSILLVQACPTMQILVLGCQVHLLLFSSSEGSGLALQEVATETGEENENVIFHANSVLFEFTDGSWKERGKGELKVNVQRGTENARLLMRARGNYRVILNARIYPEYGQER
ncbi:hypothetical protein HN51_026853 [Arachis hypogaea]